MKFIPNAIARKVAEQGLLARQNSPQILFGVGVVGMIGSTVLACRATLKMDEVLDEVSHDLNTARSIEHASYSEMDRKKDVALIYTRGLGSITLLYAPSVLLGAASIGCLTKSHNLLQERNMALTAAYAAVDSAFNRYRERVVEQYGEDVDRQLLYETEQVDVIDEETGKITTVTQVIGAPGSKYARFYDEWSSRNWSPDPDINHLFLRNQQNYVNDRLKIRGHVFLNEVYDRLGLSHTKAGAVVGWRWNQGSGDDYIDFGIWDGANERVNDFFRGHEGAILLDFNVDGVIWDKIQEEGV